MQYPYFKRRSSAPRLIVALAGQVQEIVAASMKRVRLSFYDGNSQINTGTVILSTDPNQVAGGNGIILQPNRGVLEFDIWEHGDIVNVPWYLTAATNVTATQVLVVEAMSKEEAEYWASLK